MKESEIKYVLSFQDDVEILLHELRKDREIVINEEVTEDLIETSCLYIMKWNKEDQGIDTDNRKPIIIYLNTDGGQVSAGLSLVSAIKASKTPVHIKVMSRAFSMGALIAMVGHHTTAFEYADVLIHDGSFGISGTTSKVRDTVKFQEEKEQQIKKLVLDNTLITEEKYNAMAEKEWWLTAENALELGIIDEIITSL